MFSINFMEHFTVSFTTTKIIKLPHDFFCQNIRIFGWIINSQYKNYIIVNSNFYII